MVAEVKDFETDASIFEARSFDVSATGLYVASDHEVKIGDLFKMEVELPRDRTFYATGDVVWVNCGSSRNPRGFGCHFRTIDPRFKAALRATVRELNAAMKDR